MWMLRVYNLSDDELVAEHELSVDGGLIRDVLGYDPSRYDSNPLNHEALRRVDQAFAQLRQSGRESWNDREVFLDYDAVSSSFPTKPTAKSVGDAQAA